MNKERLIEQINTIKNARRIYRDNGALFVIQNPELFPILLELIFENKTNIAIKSCWVLELVCMEKIDPIIPHLNYFTTNLNKPNHESMLRPLSKVCYFIINEYRSSNYNEIKKNLTSKNKIQIIEANFDWLIDKHKIATQVFAMDTLYLLGSEFNWIHRELKLILEQNIISGSAGYQVRAKRILKNLNL